MPVERYALLPQIALFFVLASALTGCGEAPKAAAAPFVMPPTGVTTAQVIARDVPIYLDQIGKCASPETVSIRAQASGQILKIHFTEGADVKKGQPLFEIDPAPFQVALEQVEAERDINVAALAQANAILVQYHAQLDESIADLAQNQSRQGLYVSELNRAKSLQGVIAQSDFDAKKMAADAGESQIRSNKAAIARFEAQIKQGEAAIKMTEAKIKSSEAAIGNAKINLAYTHIASPIDGRVGQRLIDVGNVVTAIGNTTQNLVTIQSMNPIYAEFSIPESELGRVRASMSAKTLSVQCTIPEKPEAPQSGEVYFIDNSIQDGTGTIRLRARIKNDDRIFWPGQFVKVRLILETRKNVPLVPAEAVQLGQTGTFVFVVFTVPPKSWLNIPIELFNMSPIGGRKPDTRAEQRPIKLGLRYDNLIAIDSGIKSGESVVLAGQLMLYSGAKVSVQNDDKKDPAKDVAVVKAEENK